jgi:hypothetical protein
VLLEPVHLNIIKMVAVVGILQQVTAVLDLLVLAPQQGLDIAAKQ